MGAMDSAAPIAFAGFGRFGQALGARLLEAGLRVRAWDPNVVVADDLRADSRFQALVEQVGFPDDPAGLIARGSDG